MNPRALFSEHVERAALEEIHRAAPDDLREHLGLRTFEIGSALVSVCTCFRYFWI